MTVFDEATAVRRRSAGIYDATVDQRFAVVTAGGTTPPAVNGGALVAQVMRAVMDGSPNPHPVAVTANFLRVAALAPAEIRVDWLKQGRTASTARAALIQDGETILDVSVTTGTVPVSPAATAAGSGTSAGSGTAGGPPGGAEPNGSPPDSASLTWTGLPPDLPPASECADLGPWRGSVSADGAEGYAMQVSVLMDPATSGWRRRDPSGLPEMRGYLSLRDGQAPDPYVLALAVDGLPPVVFGLGATGWAPTVTLTWYLRALPVPGPLRVAARSRSLAGGWFDEEAEVWDAAGSLVAQSRQMARVGRGPVRPRRPAGSAAGDTADVTGYDLSARDPGA